MDADTNIEKLAFAVFCGAPFTVLFDARSLGVTVPKRLRSSHECKLLFGAGLPIPIPDLFVDATGVSGTLSFKGRKHRCFVPWTAVYCIGVYGSPRYQWWPDSEPPEVSEWMEEVRRKARAKTIAREDVAAVEYGPSIPWEDRQPTSDDLAVVRVMANEGVRAWLRSLTDWGWRPGSSLIDAIGPGVSDVGGNAHKILDVLSRAGAIEMGKPCMSDSQRAFHGLGGLTFSARSAGYGVKVMENPGHLPVHCAWRLMPGGKDVLDRIFDRD